MRTLFIVLSTLAFASSAVAANPQRNLRSIPSAQESLLRTVSPKFYRTLFISPVKGWIVVRGQLAGTRVIGNRVIHSELNGEYDGLALDLANNLVMLGNTSYGRETGIRMVLVHVLIYEIADGRLAISFANFEDPGGTQWRYYGSAWMAVQKDADTWITIEPLRPTPHEERGPRAYTVRAVPPGPFVRLPRAIGVPRGTPR